MADWEDEYDENGVAVEITAVKSDPRVWKLPGGDFKREDVSFGVKNGTRRSESEGAEYRSRRGGGARGRWTFAQKSDASPSVTVAVEMSSVGRIIGVVFYLFLTTVIITRTMQAQLNCLALLLSLA